MYPVILFLSGEVEQPSQSILNSILMFYFITLNKDKIDEQDHDNYTYPLWELGWQINQMIHPIVYSMKDWQSKKGSPFYNNVEEEGVMLLQNSGTP